MRILLLCAAALLAGCDGPAPMSEAEAVAFGACLKDGSTPAFNATGSRREMHCNK